MFGTVAHIRAKPGMSERVIEHFRRVDLSRIAGAVALQVFRTDSNPNEFYIAGYFESREAYFTHSEKPETDADYWKLVELLEVEPEWHDGEIVHVSRGRQ